MALLGVTSFSNIPPLPPPSPPSQWKRLLRDTELMDLLAPSAEEKRALLLRDLKHSPEAAAGRFDTEMLSVL